MAEDNKFLPEICKIKHDSIDKDIERMKEDIGEIKDEKNEKHEEIKELISSLSKEIENSSINLKNKIVLSEKKAGDKIDALNDFDETLRGNGDPGIWESIRNIKRDIKIILSIVIIIAILVLGGNFKGISLEKIKKRFSNPKTKQIVTPEKTADIKTQ